MFSFVLFCFSIPFFVFRALDLKLQSIPISWFLIRYIFLWHSGFFCSSVCPSHRSPNRSLALWAGSLFLHFPTHCQSPHCQFSSLPLSWQSEAFRAPPCWQPSMLLPGVLQSHSCDGPRACQAWVISSSSPVRGSLPQHCPAGFVLLWLRVMGFPSLSCQKLSPHFIPTVF